MNPSQWSVALSKKNYLWYPSKTGALSNNQNSQIVSSDYSVYFGHSAFGALEGFLTAANHTKMVVLVDERTTEHCLPLLLARVPALREAELVEIESGEQSKAIDVATRLWQVLTELQVDRHGILINLGGGVIGDLGGFVASTYKRGIDFINIPTTLLAQVDASVGGKLGINLNMLKNQVGLFQNPKAVFIVSQFLNTLPKSEMMAGFAEMLKHGLIADPEHFDALLAFNWSRIDALEPHIKRSVEIKNQIVSEDPLERGKRKWLNFGHTIGHAIESYSRENQGAGLLHGEAVAIGMVCEAYLSVRFAGLDHGILERIAGYVLRHYPGFRIEPLAHHRLIEIMRNDKKNVGSKVNFTLLSDVGQAEFDCEVSADSVIEAFSDYQERLEAVAHEA